MTADVPRSVVVDGREYHLLPYDAHVPVAARHPAICPKCGGSDLPFDGSVPGWRCRGCGFVSSKITDFTDKEPSFKWDEDATLVDVGGRDLRDPVLGGEAIEAIREESGTTPGEVRLSVLLDSPRGGEIMAGVPNYVDSFENHPARYREELEERAANGDKYAAAVLRGDTLAEDVTE